MAHTDEFENHVQFNPSFGRPMILKLVNFENPDCVELFPFSIQDATIGAVLEEIQKLIKVRKGKMNGDMRISTSDWNLLKLNQSSEEDIDWTSVISENKFITLLEGKYFSYMRVPDLG